MSISRPFEELQVSISEFMLITPKSITGIPNWVGLVGFLKPAILDFWMSISQLFEELQGWLVELKQFMPIHTTVSNLSIIVTIHRFEKNRQILKFKVPYRLIMVADSKEGAEGLHIPPQDIESSSPWTSSLPIFKISRKKSLKLLSLHIFSIGDHNFTTYWNTLCRKHLVSVYGSFSKWLSLSYYRF